MKSLILLTCLFLLTACVGEKEKTAQTKPVEAKPAVIEQKVETPVKVVPTPEVSTAKLPFGLPIMPGARYISGSLKFSRPTKKRGGEAIATIAVQGTALDIVKYYEKALMDIGFTPSLWKHNSESVAKVTGESANGEKFLISTSRGGSKAKTGESTASIVATKPL